MNIQEIKDEINTKCGTSIGKMPMQKQTEEVAGEKVETDWVQYWNNEHRVRVIMHREVLEAITSDSTRGDLGHKLELMKAEGDRKAYTRVIVSVYDSVAVI